MPCVHPSGTDTAWGSCRVSVGTACHRGVSGAGQTRLGHAQQWELGFTSFWAQLFRVSPSPSNRRSLMTFNYCACYMPRAVLIKPFAPIVGKSTSSGIRLLGVHPDSGTHLTQASQPNSLGGCEDLVKEYMYIS